MQYGFAKPVQVCRDNPHYFEYQGKPLVLITSDHHYGAVIDRDFDYVTYLDFLSRNDMNLTRIYPGGMFEPPDKYLPGNPLGPLPGRHILPWQKSTEIGAHPALAEPGQPSIKFDLQRWNPEYFSRLRDFVGQARERGIIVEVAFFNGMYADCWPLMAFYHGNNIQGVGRYEAENCGWFTTTLSGNRDVIAYQKAYIAKIAAELNDFDNVIYDLCDEPSLAGRPDGSIIVLPDSLTAPWLLLMKDAFLAAEKELPKKHLLGQTIQNLSPDFAAQEWCDWLPAEYVKPARAAMEQNYTADKPMVIVESDYFGLGLTTPYTADDVRVEGWWFMLLGGAGVINLNGEFHRGQETGGEITRNIILPQRKILKSFVNRFDLRSTIRYSDFTILTEDVRVVALVEPAKQYGLYLFHAADDGQWGAHFTTQAGEHRDAVTLHHIPAGEYAIEWIDPATDVIVAKGAVTSTDGEICLSTPGYTIDIACRVTAQ
jgi:hypothetical protein